MKKLILLTIVCLLALSPVFSQNNDLITIEKKRFYLKGEVLKGKELKEILKSDPESAAMLKKSTTNTTIGTVFMGIGTVAILAAVANPPEEDGAMPGLISREENMKHLMPALVGAGVVLAGLPFYISGSKQLKKSVTIYNSKKSSAYQSVLNFDIGLTSNGVGITFNF